MSPLGEESAVSGHTDAWPGGEASVEEALTILQETDPAVIAASTSASLEEQSIAPSLKDAGEELSSQDTLTSSTISKETAAEYAVSTPAGELSITPVEASPNATTPPTIVNGAAAFFANTWPATDAIVRPEPLGIETMLQLRSTEAPRRFSWEIRLGPDQELKQLSDGRVAVVEASEETQPINSEEAGESGPLRDTTEGPAETSEEKTEAETEESESGSEEEAPLESLSASPETSTAAGEAAAGQPQPQQTHASYEAAQGIVSDAEAKTAGKTLMVIAAPAVTDAKGEAVPGELTTTGDTITFTIKPEPGATYPLLIDATVSAASDKASEARSPVQYGLSDQSREMKGHIDEHFDENGNVASGLDPRLKNGPLGIKTVRLVVPYDVVSRKNKYAMEKKALLEGWLRKVGREHLQPLVTISKDYKRDPCGENGNLTCLAPPSVAEYHKSVEMLMRDLVKGNTKRGFPPVELWGAWNEPDAGIDPLHKDWGRAAHYWVAASSILTSLSKQLKPRSEYCRHCVVLAGEFAYAFGYEHIYTERYRNMLLYDKTKLAEGAKRLRSPPRLWGFHAYHDVVERTNESVKRLAAFTSKRLGKPRLFMSEGGVDLRDGKKEVEVKQGADKVILIGALDLQAEAAETFRRLYTAKISSEKTSRVDREYYYMYTAPSSEEREKNVFDSGLIEIEGGHRVPRPAFCVLAYVSHICPPTVETGPSRSVSVGIKVCSSTPSSVEVGGKVNPNGAKIISYEFEYGKTGPVVPGGKYEHSTAIQAAKPTDRWLGFEAHGDIPVTAFEETEVGECPSPIHFRVVARNVQGVSHGADHVVSFSRAA
jgi:hypothetical protein